MTDKETMVLIKSKNKDCVFSQAELINWIIEIEGVSRNTANKRVPRVIKRLPVELLSCKFYRLLYTPSEELDPVKKEKKVKELTKELSIAETSRQILEYFNQKTGKNYRGKPADLAKIKSRLEERHTLEEFKQVIDKKSSEWIGSEWEKFLRPETLFGSKFEGYLNQSGNLKKQGKAEQMANYDFSKYIKGDK